MKAEGWLDSSSSMIVMKFGGTSVESAEAIGRVAGSCASGSHRRPVVVVSAMGKTTNKLLAIAAAAAAGERDAALAAIWTHLRAVSSARIGRARVVERRSNAHFDQLADLVKGLAVMGELTPRATDAISAYGERFSSLIVTAHFQRCGNRRGASRRAQRDRHRSPPHAGRAAVRAKPTRSLTATIPRLAQAAGRRHGRLHRRRPKTA